jgi:hypothetical protein
MYTQRQQQQHLTKIKWDPKQLENFVTEFDYAISQQQWNNNSIVKSAFIAAKKTGMKKNIQLQPRNKINDAEWYDDECRKMRQDIRIMIKACRRSHNATIAAEIRKKLAQLKLQYDRMKKEKRKLHNENLLQNVIHSKNTKQFWESIKKFRPSKSNASNNISTKQWEEHFSKLFKKQEQKPSQPKTPPPRPPPTTPNTEMDLPITEEELMTAVKKLSKNKAPGIDGIPNEVLKAISIRHRHNLLKIMNEILESGEIPQQWSTSLIHPIYKKGDKEDPSNFSTNLFIVNKLEIIDINNR